MNGPSVHDRTSVFGMPQKDLIGILSTNPITGRTDSVRFPRERVRQLCIDLLDMEEHLGDRS